MKLGIWQPGITDSADGLAAANVNLGGKLSLASFYHAFNRPPTTRQLSNCWIQGVTPMLTLEPWDPLNRDNRDYSLEKIVHGKHDGYLAAWARVLRYPTWVRFGHEFNGNWYPWAGNASLWRQAFDRIHSLMPAHVQMVWSPNVIYSGSAPIEAFWTEKADVIAVDGYAWKGESVEQTFAMTVAAVRQYSRPIWIGETSCTGTDQAPWVASLGKLPVEGVVWFNERKEVDWRLTRSGRQAFVGLAKDNKRGAHTQDCPGPD